MTEGVVTEVRHNTERLRYEMVVDGEVVGFVQYNVRGGRIVLAHTEINPEYGGRGLATSLAQGALDDIRSRGQVHRARSARSSRATSTSIPSTTTSSTTRCSTRSTRSGRTARP